MPGPARSPVTTISSMTGGGAAGGGEAGAGEFGGDEEIGGGESCAGVTGGCEAGADDTGGGVGSARQLRDSRLAASSVRSRLAGNRAPTPARAPVSAPVSAPVRGPPAVVIAAGFRIGHVRRSDNVCLCMDDILPGSATRGRFVITLNEERRIG